MSSIIALILVVISCLSPQVDEATPEGGALSVSDGAQ